jgi:hypothetical protein
MKKRKLLRCKKIVDSRGSAMQNIDIDVAMHNESLTSFPKWRVPDVYPKPV